MSKTKKNNVKFVACQTYHGRRGSIANKFRYHLDCLLLPVNEPVKSNNFFLGINKFSLFSFFDKDHGGGSPIRQFADLIVKDQKLDDICTGEIWLLTQPRFAGYVFNPVSFWFFLDEVGLLRVVLAEVNNTVKGRHFYVCHHNDFAPIKPGDKIDVEKVFYVSPFQDVAGQYTFKFQFDAEGIGAWIDYQNGEDGVYATMTGRPQSVTNGRLLWSALTRPFGAIRVITLIHWQAVKLKLKGARYRKAPVQNKERVTR